MANYVFRVQGIYRAHNQGCLNLLPNKPDYTPGPETKFFYMVGSVVEEQVEFSPSIENYFWSSDNEIVLYVKGNNLFNIQSVTFDFDDGNAPVQAPNVRQIREDRNTTELSRTEEPTFLEVRADNARRAILPDNPPDAVITGNDLENCRFLQGVIPPRIIEAEKSLASEVPDINRNQMISLPGINLYYPIFVSTNQEVPITFVFPENGQAVTRNVSPLLNLKDYYLGNVDEIIISEAQYQQWLNKTNINYDANLREPPPPEYTLNETYTPPPPELSPCVRRHKEKEEIYSQWHLWSGEHTPGGYSYVVDKYWKTNAAGQPLYFYTVFRDPIGIVSVDERNGDKSYRIQGNWVSPGNHFVGGKRWEGETPPSIESSCLNPNEYWSGTGYKHVDPTV